jgi:hypothetical protein
VTHSTQVVAKNIHHRDFPENKKKNQTTNEQHFKYQSNDGNAVHNRQTTKKKKNKATQERR